MAINKFLLFSIVFHLALFLGMYFVPEPKIEKAREFITSLVSPEELKKPEIRVRPLPTPVPKPIPRLKAFPGPRPSLPSQKRIIPGRPPLPLEKPVVPGEGSEIGKPLPERTHPKIGGEDRKGEGGGGSKGESNTKDTRNAVEPGKPGFSVGKSLREEADAAGKRDSRKPGRQGQKDEAVTFDTAGYEFAGYMRNLREKIESIWIYPPEAAAHGIYGDLKIQFTINKDGRLGAVELVRTSGHKMLDDAAMKALKDGEPYWPLPDSWGKDSYTILGHFVYVYGGYYIK